MPILVKGLVSANTQQHIECIQVLGEMIKDHGLDACSPVKTLEALAGQTKDDDDKVQTAAINTCSFIHELVGNKVYDYLNKTSNEQMHINSLPAFESTPDLHNSTIRGNTVGELELDRIEA